MILVARDAEALAQVRDEIVAGGGEASVFSCDLSDRGARAELIDRVKRECGDVQTLINNAGLSIRRPLDQSWDRAEDFERMLELNHRAAQDLILGFAPGMTERGEGHIVNVSTIGAQTGAPNFAGYISSKAALDQFSRSASLELSALGVHFSTLYMGLVRTRMVAPTKIYDRFPAASTETAAARIACALIYRPIRMSTAIGYIVSVLDALSPRLVAWMFRVWHDRVHVWFSRRG